LIKVNERKLHLQYAPPLSYHQLPNFVGHFQTLGVWGLLIEFQPDSFHFFLSTAKNPYLTSYSMIEQNHNISHFQQTHTRLLTNSTDKPQLYASITTTPVSTTTTSATTTTQLSIIIASLPISITLFKYTQ